MKHTGSETTWPDVGLAIVEFAREDPLTFVLVLLALGFVLWLQFPGTTRKLEKSYIRKLQRSAKQALGAPTEEDADVEQNGE